MERNERKAFPKSHGGRKNKVTADICASKDREDCTSFPNSLHCHGSSSHRLAFELGKQDCICVMHMHDVVALQGLERKL